MSFTKQNVSIPWFAMLLRMPCLFSLCEASSGSNRELGLSEPSVPLLTQSEILQPYFKLVLGLAELLCNMHPLGFCPHKYLEYYTF